MTPNQAPEPLWTPDDCSQAESAIARFQAFACRRHELDLHLDRQDYAELWRWSVAEPADFWAAVWDFFELGERGPGPVIDAVPMPGTGWFHGTTVNLAEAVLAAGEPQDVAVVGVCECGAGDTLTRAALREQVASVAEGLRNLGIGSGDRVVGYLPNTPEAVVAFLAVASVGALWSAVGQDYAPRAVVDRFAQLEPVLLFACDGYHWNGATVDRSADVRTVRELLPTLRHTVLVPHLCEAATGEAEPGTLPWSTLVETDGSAHVAERLPFDHPLWVLFSSGTTGLPKGLVHGHGGILVEAVKQLGLHVDVRPGDRFFWYTSPSWMMWNFQLLALLRGAGILTYDGSPLWPDARAMWAFVAQHGVTMFGLSPGLLVATEAADIHPGKEYELSTLRWMGSTGSPLSPHSHRWAAAEVGEIPLVSLTGGTDVCSAFAGGAPTLPIWPGELSARSLGVALDAWDEAGRSVRGQVGEMVITAPLPSMPLYLWNDTSGERYRKAYFATYPGVWRHGDWITITDRDSLIVHGRSDSTLNRGGIRMGSADIYAALERIPEVLESLVIGAEQPDGGYWMPLFVVLADGAHLDDDLRARIRGVIREHASPRHVPDEIRVVRGVPHTRTGKKLEVPVKRILQGADPAVVANPEAVDDPSLLAEYVALAAAHRGTT